MIAQHDVYQKTAKGSEAIATRQHGLAPKVRSLLILVDGKRNVDDLRKLSGVNGNAEQFIGELLESGCIARAAPAAGSGVHAASATATPTGARPAAATAAVTLAESRRHAVRRLTDLLGPLADDICMRLEASKTADEFLVALARAEDMLRQVRGGSAAAGFSAHMTAYRPSRT